MLIGVSLSQVFYNQAIKLYNDNQRMLPLLKKTIGMLLVISIMPFTILYLFGEPIFAWIFGANWADAGSYSETMSFWLMVSFVISPISALPMILKKQKIAFVFGTISALIQVIPLIIIPAIYGSSNEIFILSLQVISYSQALWFLLVLVIYFIFVYRYDNQLLNSPSVEK
jgi:O-antigen/teichoic acid export membrane protein